MIHFNGGLYPRSEREPQELREYDEWIIEFMEIWGAKSDYTEQTSWSLVSTLSNFKF